MWHSRPPRDPPPFLANAILNFHFDFLHPSLKLYTKSAAFKYFARQVIKKQYQKIRITGTLQTS